MTVAQTRAARRRLIIANRGKRKVPFDKATTVKDAKKGKKR